MAPFADRIGRAVRALTAALAGAAAIVAITAGAVHAAPAAPAPSPSSAPAIATAVTPAPPVAVPTSSQLPGIYGPGFDPGAGVPPPSGPLPGQDAPAPSDPGFFDIPGQIEKAIDTWIGDLVKAILVPVLGFFVSLMLASPNLTGGRIEEVWDGVLVTANTIYILFVLAGAVTVMGYETVQTRHSVKEIAPRLVIGMVVSNASLWLINQVISLGNALSEALLNGKISSEGIGNTLTSLIMGRIFIPGVTNIFLIILGLAIGVLGVVLALTCLMRVVVLIILTVGAPLAFACHALPQTEGLAKLWWRAIFGCVAVEVAQALILITAVQVFFDPNASTIMGTPSPGGLMDLLICLVLFLVLMKIPSWTLRIVMGRSPFGMGIVGRMARNLLYYKAIRSLESHGGRIPWRRQTRGDFVYKPPPPPPSPGTGLVPFAGGPRPGGGGSGQDPAAWTVTRVFPSGSDGPRASGGPHAPGPVRPALPGGSQLALPMGLQDRLAARQKFAAEQGRLRYRQNGLFPPVPRDPNAVRTADSEPPPWVTPPSATRTGNVQHSLFSPATFEPTRQAFPPPPKIASSVSPAASAAAPSLAARATPMPQAAKQSAAGPTVAAKPAARPKAATTASAQSVRAVVTAAPKPAPAKTAASKARVPKKPATTTSDPYPRTAPVPQAKPVRVKKSREQVDAPQLPFDEGTDNA